MTPTTSRVTRRFGLLPAAQADAERGRELRHAWLGRLIIESPAITLNEVMLAVAAMQGLQGPDAPLAFQTLKYLAARQGTRRGA